MNIDDHKLKLGIWICPVCRDYSIPEEHKLKYIHYCRSCTSKLEVICNDNPTTAQFYTLKYREVT